MDIRSGGALENSDYITVSYELDGVVTDIATRTNNFNGDAPETVTATGLTGSTLKVIIKVDQNFYDEFYYFDNISISPTSAVFGRKRLFSRR